MAAIKRGSPSAEAELVERYQRSLSYLANHYTRDEDLAREVVQETLIVVLQRLRTASILEPKKLTPFVHSTARNIMIGCLRKIDRRQTYANTPAIERTCADIEGQESVTSRWEDAQIVRKLLQALPSQRDREILTRFYLEEEAKGDICQTLQLSDVHFNWVLYRARKRFGALVEEYEQQQKTSLLNPH